MKQTNKQKIRNCINEVDSLDLDSSKAFMLGKSRLNPVQTYLSRVHICPIEVENGRAVI